MEKGNVRQLVGQEFRPVDCTFECTMNRYVIFCVSVVTMESMIMNYLLKLTCSSNLDP